MRYNFTKFRLIVGALSVIIFSSFNNQSINEPADDEFPRGFYMNKGCTKIDSITCYGFEGFRYVHEVNELKAYDKISYSIGIGTKKGLMGIEGNSFHEVEGRIYRSIVGDNEYVSVYLPKASDNMKHTKRKKSVEESYYMIKVSGSLITKYEEKWDSAREAYVKKPIYEHSVIIEDKIPLKNREFVKGGFWEKLPIIGKIVQLARKPLPEPERDESCYPCEGEDPGLVEFDPTKY